MDECWLLFDRVLEYDSDVSLNIVANFGYPSQIRMERGAAKALRRQSRTVFSLPSRRGPSPMHSRSIASS
jgi:hypothetical protein